MKAAYTAAGKSSHTVLLPVCSTSAHTCSCNCLAAAALQTPACPRKHIYVCVCVDIADLIVVDDDLLCLATAIRHAVPVPGMHMRLSCRWRGAPGQVELRALYDPRKMFPLHPIAVTQPSLECRYRHLSWLDTEPSIVTEPTCRQRPSPTTSPRSSLMAGGTAQRERQLTDGKTNY